MLNLSKLQFKELLDKTIKNNLNGTQGKESGDNVGSFVDDKDIESITWSDNSLALFSILGNKLPKWLRGLILFSIAYILVKTFLFIITKLRLNINTKK